MRLLEHSSDEFARLNAYLQNTHGATHTAYALELLDAWAVQREGEAERFQPFQNDPNRMLLWHGSRITNWGGILSQGLRIAPPEAPSTGYMFGKGVYFADMSSKSANYCFTTSEKTAGVLMLCEVALGESYKLKKAEFVEKLKKPFLSTFGMGKNHPSPAGAYREDSGCVIPMGKGEPSGVNDTSLLYNEFIVYNVAQVKTRYVLRLNFKYNKKAGTFF
jgi:poly [ADP-ribose] polymerase